MQILSWGGVHKQYRFIEISPWRCSRGQALKCSASEALNAESYYTLRDKKPSLAPTLHVVAHTSIQIY